MENDNLVNLDVSTNAAEALRKENDYLKKAMKKQQHQIDNLTRDLHKFFGMVTNDPARKGKRALGFSDLKDTDESDPGTDDDLSPPQQRRQNLQVPLTKIVQKRRQIPQKSHLLVQNLPK